MRLESPAPDTPIDADTLSGIGAWWAENWSMIVGKLVAVLIILAIALLVRWILHFVIERVVNRVVSGVKKKEQVTDTQALQASPLAAVRVVQRTRTLGSVLTNVVNVTLFIVVTLMIVATINSEILGSFALLSAAIGAGLGFGAQNIVKDALNGLFMVVEDQLGVGDIVDLGPATGIVEAVRIRITTVRDVNGTLWFVRNGEILRVGNLSQGWARVIVDLAVPYDADIEEVEAELLKSANELANTPKWRSRIVEKPEVWGLESISDDAMVIRVVMKVRAASKDDVARELRVRLKRTVDGMGVKMPSLSSVVLSGLEGVTRVKGARPPKTSNTVLPENQGKRPKAPRAPRLGRTPKNPPTPPTPPSGGPS
ncbi:mechanosensitive ion channel family protein [Agromyces aerolatus]|uniref:mechanosensitive ion channel family protein n=1 Tax=Agromyces sp. LY-1074 TaxID=3074080 RepID=UPI00285B819D|nr:MULTISPECIES: mechanosensitive ion channel family protein [unclassified Agromyces]MDR5699877.1 mechanosensitive ion channel family protein [Agromyces sp. LY-1074]MDR5706311.1 mechanosensitive ion channel family protein [Agromyces sp. LY-1358]